MSRYNYGGWRPYVPVAERQANARRQLAKLIQQGVEIQPIERIGGRIIARSFWGKGWCDHLDSFGDYANRLPRGRTYVRNGSVCHLKIDKGKVEAFVSGSEIYTVNITIDPLTASQWSGLKKRCTGRIGSLLELLQGRLSEEIMNVVTDRHHGLFPQPGEIKYDCNCPDWAGMCKHVAAVIYGVGVRLDERPELLFVLRGVDHEDLIDADAAAAASISGPGGRGRSRRRSLAAESLEDVFGVELEAGESEPPKPRPRAAVKTAKKATVKKAAKKGAAKKVAKKAAVKKAARKVGAAKRAGKEAVFKATGQAVAALRRKLGLGKAAFAREVGVSAPTISNWESARGAIHPHPKGLEGLRRLHGRAWSPGK